MHCFNFCVYNALIAITLGAVLRDNIVPCPQLKLWPPTGSSLNANSELPLSSAGTMHLRPGRLLTFAIIKSNVLHGAATWCIVRWSVDTRAKTVRCLRHLWPDFGSFCTCLMMPEPLPIHSESYTTIKFNRFLVIFTAIKVINKQKFTNAEHTLPAAVAGRRKISRESWPIE